MARNHYEVLGVSNAASREEVRRAYRKLAMKWHPDRNPAVDAKARFQEINAAYECLKQSKSREAYDRAQRRAQQTKQESPQPRAEPKQERPKQSTAKPPPPQPEPAMTMPEPRARYVLYAAALAALLGSNWLMPVATPINAAVTPAASEARLPPRDVEHEAKEEERKRAEAARTAAEEASRQAAEARRVAEEHNAALERIRLARLAEEQEAEAKSRAAQREAQEAEQRAAGTRARWASHTAPLFGEPVAQWTICGRLLFKRATCNEVWRDDHIAFIAQDASTDEYVTMRLTDNDRLLVILRRDEAKRRGLSTFTFGKVGSSMLTGLGFTPEMLRICARDRTATFAREGMKYRCTITPYQGGKPAPTFTVWRDSEGFHERRYSGPPR